MESDPKKRLMAVFLQELRERTAQIERDLLSLEQAESASEHEKCVQSLLRAVHSLKGAAGLVRAQPIEAVCHRMEDVLTSVRDELIKLEAPTMQLLLSGADAIADAGAALARGEKLEVAALRSLAHMLAAASQARKNRTPAQAERNAEPAAEPIIASGEEATAVSTKQEEDHGEAFVRVSAAKLDALLKQSGELLIARSRARLRMEQLALLQDQLRAADRAPARRLSKASPGAPDAQVLGTLSKGLQALSAGFASDRKTIDLAADALETEVRRARLQPISSACAGLDRLVRDLSIASEKDVRVEVRGGDVQIDRSIMERLTDILRHLVRNAMDHGMERVAERRSAGKSERGRIAIHARLIGNRLTLSVADDGRGIDLEKIREAARKSGAAEAAALDPMQQIFTSGLSTAETVTTVSGRGLGLSIVKTAVERMRGAIDVASRAGHGTTFTLTLPLTFGTIRALLVRAGEQVFALDTSSIAKVIRITPEAMRPAEGRAIVLTGSSPSAALDLTDWLGLRPATGETEAADIRPAIILNDIGRGAAILIDAVLAEQECLVRSMGRRLKNVRHCAGGSVLPDGTVALVLNAALLGEAAYMGRSLSTAHERQDAMPSKRILIAEDSLTVRALTKTILEEAGYEVVVAGDGTQAWQSLKSGSIDLVLADIDMPGLDGFTLTEKIRQSAHFRNLPVILLTARETEADRRRGLEAGADAYLVKSAFDQRELLNSIGQLV